MMKTVIDKKTGISSNTEKHKRIEFAACKRGSKDTSHENRFNRGLIDYYCEKGY